MMHASEFFSSARERYRIRHRRLTGEPWPWTQDPEFREYRFTNVHREHDATTIWCKENVRDQYQGPTLALAVTAFRWFNRIDVGELLRPYWSAWDEEAALSRLKMMNGPVTTGAFMVKSPTGMTKAEGVCWCITQASGRIRDMSQSWGESLESAWRDLVDIPYLGPFTAYEVVSDLRWTHILEGANDINTWASVGPGCTKGLGWVTHGDADHWRLKTDQDAMLPYLVELLAMSKDENYWPAVWQPWELREVEHWLCEFWKLTRTRNGCGRPRQRFPKPKVAELDLPRKTDNVTG